MAKAQIGHRRDLRRQIQDFAQVPLAEDADPADPDPFGPGGQPEVLHRADSGIEVGVQVMRAPQHGRPAPGPVAGDAEVQRRLADALQLELGVERPARLAEHLPRLGVGAVERGAHRLPHAGVADHDEVPRLRQADRGRGVGGLEDPGQRGGVDRIGQELAAHVATLADGAVDGGALGGREGPGRAGLDRLHDMSPVREASGRGAVRAPRSMSSGRSSDLASSRSGAFPARASGLLPPGPPHSAGHVADLHRVPDYSPARGAADTERNRASRLPPPRQPRPRRAPASDAAGDGAPAPASPGPGASAGRAIVSPSGYRRPNQ